jgi:hypothetical protein
MGRAPGDWYCGRCTRHGVEARFQFSLLLLSWLLLLLPNILGTREPVTTFARTNRGMAIASGTGYRVGQFMELEDFQIEW